ncbi:hypothetical protein E3T38_05095 [Cryobacterium sp. Hb1]|nr:hypothetical protein E3T38_05095 [Cryobacterium sp. Hb1]
MGAWDEILRLAAPITTGTVTACLMMRKLGAYPARTGRVDRQPVPKKRPPFLPSEPSTRTLPNRGAKRRCATGRQRVMVPPRPTRLVDTAKSKLTIKI